MIRFSLALLLFTATLLAANLSSGDSFPLDIKLQDQFEKTYSLEGKEVIVFSGDKASGKFTHNVVEAYPKEVIEEKQIAFISDMSSVPSLVYTFFMQDTFQNYDYRLGLIWEEDEAKKLSHKDEQVTVYKLDGDKVEEVKYFKDEKSLKAYLDSL